MNGNSREGKTAGSGDRMPGSECGSPFLVVKAWANHLTCLILRCLTDKMKIMATLLPYCIIGRLKTARNSVGHKVSTRCIASQLTSPVGERLSIMEDSMVFYMLQ